MSFDNVVDGFHCYLPGFSSTADLSMANLTLLIVFIYAYRLILCTVFLNAIFVNYQKVLIRAVECLKEGIFIGNYIILSTHCSAARASYSLSALLCFPFKDKGYSVTLK